MKLTADPKLTDLQFDQRIGYVQRFACPFCGRGAGQMCRGLAGNKAAFDYDNYVHRAREKLAADQYRLEMAQKK